jgi:hypothetical protein
MRAQGNKEMQDKVQTLKNGPTNIHVWIKHKLLRAMQDFAGPAGLGVQANHKSLSLF